MLHVFAMYTSLLEVEHEGGSHNESCIEIENDDLWAELLHHVVRVGLHQDITAVHLQKLEIGVFFHQRWQRWDGYLQREWDLTGSVHPDPRSQRLCGADTSTHLYSTYTPHTYTASQCARSRILLYTLTLFKKDFPNFFNGLNLPRYDV